VFTKILIANRGEIAIRVIETCRRLGVKTVAVYSEADMRSLYVKEADEAVFIGPAVARDSYLNVQKLISAALERGCEAIHPGYGFLSENADFAQRVRDAGLVFIGPSPEAIACLGDKVASKALAIRLGVPVVPGHPEPLNDVAAIVAVVSQIGYPILLKPAAGGGGRGMRIVHSEAELPTALSACKEETRKSFADDRIFVERYVVRPRHIEVQIMADQHGNVIHLGERECSVQRRHQKVIEETPSPVVDPALRQQMTEMACRLALSGGYSNAGTVEYILDANRNFYFLEMNTRLQVEHPVTEMVTGLDLVELQLRVANGERLPLRQEDVNFQGWAIEARICAEDPYRNFLPTTGLVTRYARPIGKHIRVDSGIDAGSQISIYYDSLLAKVAAWGKQRTDAITTLIKALNGYHIEGLISNIDFANAILNHEAFVQGNLATSFIEEHFEQGERKTPAPLEQLHVTAMGAVLVYHNRKRLVIESLKPLRPMVGGIPNQRKVYNYMVRAGRDVLEIQLKSEPQSSSWTIRVGGVNYEVVTPEFEYYRRRLKLKINGVSQMVRLQYQQRHIRVHFCGLVRTWEIYTPKEWALEQYMIRERKGVKENVLKCPMPGLITAIPVKLGVLVHRGEELIRLESMKMETGIASPVDAYIEAIEVKPGDTVDTNQILIRFRA
jgi:propionyl-CoA carboxylase alpha chain